MSGLIFRKPAYTFSWIIGGLDWIAGGKDSGNHGNNGRDQECRDGLSGDMKGPVQNKSG